MNQEYYNIDIVKQQARGQWRSLIESFGGILPGSKRHGPCPVCGGKDRFRFDDKNGEGTWFCSHGDQHSSGKQAGDGLGLITDMLNGDFKEALSRIGKAVGAPTEKYKQQDSSIPLVDKWAEYILERTNEVQKKKPKYVWPWFENHYIIRVEFTTKEGVKKKIVNQIRVEDGKKYVVSIEHSRKLLGSLTDKPVLIVEGETTYDAARRLLSEDFDVVTWIGGSKQVPLSDWTVLKDKEVYIWPDNDSEGLKAAWDIFELASNFVSDIKYVKTPHKAKKGWDLRDAIEFEKWNKSKVNSYLRNNLEEFKGLPPGVENINYDDEPIRYLGFKGDTMYVVSSQTKCIESFSLPELTKSRLFWLAPKAYWTEKFFTGGEGEPKVFSFEKAKLHVIKESQKAGIYNSKIVRGLGCWNDQGRKVFHLGEQLIVDGKSVNILKFNSKYVYERSSFAEHLDLSDPLEIEHLQYLAHFLQFMNWQHKGAHKLFCGWLISSVICGYLLWRSHIWIKGEAGCGKSTIIQKVIEPLLSNFSILADYGTTPAGLKQTIKRDAMPIILDEAEASNKQERENMDGILAYARSCSGDHNANTLKGTSGQEAVSYQNRSMFANFSISANLSKKSDKDRWTVLNLLKATDNNRNWHEQIKPGLDWIMGFPNMSNKFIARCFVEAEKHKANFVQIQLALMNMGCSARFADQFGILLAGWSCFNPEIQYLTLKEAEDFIKAEIDLTPWMFVLDEDEKEEAGIWDKILSHELKFEFGNEYHHLTIGQALDRVKGTAWPTKTNAANPGDDVIKEKLRTWGIRWDEQNIYISKKNTNLTQKLYLPSDYTDMLSRIDGAQSVKGTMYFGLGQGTKRVVAISWIKFAAKGTLGEPEEGEEVEKN